jgi:hypothetical protein
LTANASSDLLKSNIGDDLIDIFSESIDVAQFSDDKIKEKAK